MYFDFFKCVSDNNSYEKYQLFNKGEIGLPNIIIQFTEPCQKEFFTSNIFISNLQSKINLAVLNYSY